MANLAIGRVTAETALSVLPVLLFLLVLALIDTYRLLTLRRILRTLAVGTVVAVACWLVNTAVYQAGVLTPEIWTRTGAPVVEELGKALYVAWLIRSNRVGFMVDTAISGFAVGAGFSAVENITYLPVLGTAGLLASAVRGLGTAMMHGGTTAIFAVVSNNLAEIRGATPARIFIPGLTLAVFVHALYNQPLLGPVQQAVVILIGLPVLLAFLFRRSEKALEKWVGARLDKNIDLLETIHSGEFSASHAGRYLQSLKSSFSPDIVGDMLCYLQLSLELSVRAKGDLLRREMGFEVPPAPELPSQIREMSWLESRIGVAGKLALAPLLAQSRRDIWEMLQLADGE